MAPPLTAIVAVDVNWGIGRDNGLLMRLPPDMRRFRLLTLGHTVVMGRKTFASLPGGRALPDRRNIVLTRGGQACPGAETCADMETLLSQCLGPDETVFVMGGAQVYALLLPHCSAALVTKIEADLSPWDSCFPNLDATPGWAPVEESAPATWEDVSFRYVTYQNSRYREG